MVVYVDGFQLSFCYLVISALVGVFLKFVTVTLVPRSNPNAGSIENIALAILWPATIICFVAGTILLIVLSFAMDIDACIRSRRRGKKC